METEDPRQALTAKDVKTRAAAARDLARIGGWDDLQTLVTMAMTDKSSAVRLYTAAAAADIVARRRGARGQTPLDDAQKKQVHAWVKAVDPGDNPSLLMMLSAVPDAASLERLARMLKDPRNGVRAGAATALRRMALSGASQDVPGLRDAVQKAFADPKVPQDVQIELVRLVGEVGWSGMDAEVRRASGLGRPHVAAAEEATKRVASRQDAAAWTGVWVDEGLDVLELADPRGKRWICVRQADGRLVASEAGGKDTPFVVEGGVAKLGNEPARLVYAPRIGEHEPRYPALQVGGATLWKQEGKDLVAFVDDWMPTFVAGDTPTLQAIATWLEGVEGTLATRGRALVALASGDAKAAVTLLEELAGHKKPRADVYWWLGKAYADLGKKKQAIEALDQFLDKSGKKADFRKEAEDLRKSL